MVTLILAVLLWLQDLYNSLLCPAYTMLFSSVFERDVSITYNYLFLMKAYVRYYNMRFVNSTYRIMYVLVEAYIITIICCFFVDVWIGVKT